MQKRLFLKFGGCQMMVAIVYSYFQILLKNNGYSYTEIGYIQAVFEVFGVIGPLVVGSLIDRTGRFKPFMLGATVLSAVFYVAVAFVKSDIIASMAATAGLSFVFLNINSVNDTMGMKQLGGDTEKYGKVRAFGSITYVMMQVLFSVAKFPDINSNRSIALTMAAISAVFFVIVLVNPEVSYEKGGGSSGSGGDSNGTRVSGTGGNGTGSRSGSGGDGWSDFGGRWYDSVFFIGMAAIFFLHIPCSVVDRMLPLYLVDVIGAGDSFTLFLGLQAFCEIIAMLIVSKKLKEGKVKPYLLFPVSAAGLLIRMLIYMFIPTVTGCIISALFHSVTFGSFFPAAITFINKHTSSDRKATGMAIYTGLATGVPAALCTVFGGKIIDDFGYNTLFVSAAAFSVVSILTVFFYRKRFRACA